MLHHVVTYLYFIHLELFYAVNVICKIIAIEKSPGVGKIRCIAFFPCDITAFLLSSPPNQYSFIPEFCCVTGLSRNL